MEQLQKIYDRYIQELTAVKKAASPLADVFGSGGTKNHPCHTIFYKDLGEWVEAFLSADPAEEAVFSAAAYILSAAAPQRKKPAYWYCFAAQGYLKQLIPLLSDEHCAILRQNFDELYSEQERLPLNQEIYDLLCRRGGHKSQKKRFFDFFR